MLSKTYPTSGYNLAHITRHARLLAGGYFTEKRLKYFLTFIILAPDYIYVLTTIYYLHKPSIANMVVQSIIIQYV